jgi:hypothetical protein
MRRSAGDGDADADGFHTDEWETDTDGDEWEMDTGAETPEHRRAGSSASRGAIETDEEGGGGGRRRDQWEEEEEFGGRGGQRSRHHNQDGKRQGHPLVHSSAPPEPFLVTEPTASVHFSAQPETFLAIKPPNMNSNIAHKKCSRQAERWTRVAHK